MQSAAASIPSPLLSQSAAHLTLEDVNAISRTEQGFILHLREVAPSADLWSLFGRWDGQFTVQGPGPDGTAAIRFSSAGAHTEAVAAFGGGLRGLFRIQPALPASTGRRLCP